MTNPLNLNRGSLGADVLTPAQKLMEKHSAEPHTVTVEDAVDEDDIPPSGLSSAIGVDTTKADRPDEKIAKPEGTSEKSKGPSDGREPSKHSQGNAPPNPRSEELFPALGPPRERNPSAVTPAWGKIPARVNVINGFASGIASSQSSRASTPNSGMATPTSTATMQSTQNRAHAPSLVSLPGRHTERIAFVPAQLVPRSQLRKPVQDVLRDINKRSKARVEMRPGPGDAIIFEGQGPVDAVRQALKEVANQLGSKQSTKVTIPASVRPHVIGRQGAMIQGMSKRTGARIHVPKLEEQSPRAEDEDDFTTIDVLIEGDAVAAEMARREIEAIVQEKTSTVNMRLRDIPAEYYPFLAGAHNSRLSALQVGRDVRVDIPYYHTWANQPPAQPSSRSHPATFVAQPNYAIQISGDRTAAQAVRAEIEHQVEQLKAHITSDQIPIERGRHQFVLGDKGCTIHDFLEETGCAIVLPPSTADSEILTVIGPADKLDAGINKVMDLASSMSMASVDIARQHANAPAGAQTHAKNVTKYLRQRQALEQLERQHDASIILPMSKDGPTVWEVYSRDGKKAMRARAEVMNLISGHPPSRLANLKVDPFFHEYLQVQHAQRIREESGVHIVFPDLAEDSSDVLLVYEGPSAPSEYEFPRRQPSAEDIGLFQQALRIAESRILSLVEGREIIVSKELDVPQRFVGKIRRFAKQEQQNLSENVIPVSMLLGQLQSQEGTSASGNQNIYMRGPQTAVDDLVAKVLLFVEQEKQLETERAYSTSFDYPQKYANVLIGKKGENVRKLREEFDVDIQVVNGKVELKGPKAKADAAKSQIIALGKRLEDEITHVLKIQPQYHGDLIGTKGGQVRRLQERYGVRITFPRTPTGEVVDTMGEAIVTQKQSRQSALDEVTIKGPRRGADEARDELLNLLQWTMDNSHTATVSVAQAQIPSLIGQGGREMENLRLSSGAQVDVPAHQPAAGPDGRVEIKLRGTKKQVEDAKKLLDARVKTFDNTVVRTVDIPKEYHKAIIGSNGSKIRTMIAQAGGPDDRQSRMVRFPPQGSPDATIKVEGERAVVDKVISMMESFVKELETHVKEVVEVAQAKHNKLIGRGGETRRAIESRFKVNIEIPKKDTTGPAGSQIKISGLPADVQSAKAHVMSIVAGHEGETFLVPGHLHHRVADHGSFIRRLRTECSVSIDHAGHETPTHDDATRSYHQMQRPRVPLITDEAQSDGIADQHSWKLIDHTISPQGPDEPSTESTIPWILRGTEENVGRAREMLESAVEEARKQAATGYLVLPDPRMYRIVVGPGGSQVNSIRRKTGTKIHVPRDAAKNGAIEIMGSKEGVLEARDLILNVISQSMGTNGRGSDVQTET